MSDPFADLWSSPTPPPSAAAAAAPAPVAPAGAAMGTDTALPTTTAARTAIPSSSTTESTATAAVAAAAAAVSTLSDPLTEAQAPPPHPVLRGRVESQEGGAPLRDQVHTTAASSSSTTTATATATASASASASTSRPPPSLFDSTIPSRPAAGSDATNNSCGRVSDSNGNNNRTSSNYTTAGSAFPQSDPYPTETAPEADTISNSNGAAAAEATLGQMRELFVSTKPKHVLDGLGDAVRNTAVGVGLGLTSVVAGTVAGSQEGGFKGGAMGFGAGLVGLIGFTGYGLGCAARQLISGTVNTVEALNRSVAGDALWDSNKQAWVEVHLRQQLETLPTTDADMEPRAQAFFQEQQAFLQGVGQETMHGADQGAAAGSGNTSNNAVSSPTPSRGSLYTLLDLDPTATPADIRSAYIKKSLVMHPDKNPQDPRATEKFQKLIEAYTILKDPRTRAAYDRDGTIDGPQGSTSTGAATTAQVNPLEEVLGTAFLEPFIGPLAYTRYFAPGLVYDESMRQELHDRRKLRLARQLLFLIDDASIQAEQLQDTMDANTTDRYPSAAATTGETRASNSFSSSWASTPPSTTTVPPLSDAHVAVVLPMIQDAIATRLGIPFMTWVAEQYQTAARQQLYDSSYRRELDSFFTSKYKGLESGARLVTKGTQLAYLAYKESAEERNVMDLMAAANESDVRRTVLQACRLICYDADVDVAHRKRRAARLAELSALVLREVNKAAAELAERQRVA